MSKTLTVSRVKHRRFHLSLRLPADLIAALDRVADAWQQEAGPTQADIDRTFVVEVLLREAVDREGLQ